MTKPETLTVEQLRSAALKHAIDDLEEARRITSMATALSLKTGISLIEAYELLAKIGMYMIQNPGVKR